MELLKRKIHMWQSHDMAQSQTALEGDVNLPENKPDISHTIAGTGEVIIEEITPSKDQVNIKGKLVFRYLYDSAEEGIRLLAFEGKIPFEERIYMEGVSAADTVLAKAELEDLKMTAIHSRKINVRALLYLQTVKADSQDIEVADDVRDGKDAQYRIETVPVTEVAAQKKDMLRIREEIALPSGYPDIYQILMYRVSPGDMEYRPGEDVFFIQGELLVSVLYEAPGERHEPTYYETTIPVNGKLECPGAEANMTGKVFVTPGPVRLVSRPDLNGEERSMELEASFEMMMYAYEEEGIRLIADLYGVNKEVDCMVQQIPLSRLLGSVHAKTVVDGSMHLGQKEKEELRILYKNAVLRPEDTQVLDGRLVLSGIMEVTVWYATGDDNEPFRASMEMFPYQYEMEMAGLQEGDFVFADSAVSKLQVGMISEEEVEVKAVLSFSVYAWTENNAQILTEIHVGEIDSEKQKKLPAIVIYTVKPGDNLWNIGKKYYVTVDKLKEVNQLVSDFPKEGSKLFISRI